MIQEINFSLVNKCNAKCFFCPRDDYKAKKTIMPLELVKKVVNETRTKKFKNKGHEFVHSSVGENGEPTLHPKLIEALRLIKGATPSVNLFTNFSGLTKEKSEAILKEGLISAIHTNVDGLTNETYKRAKGLSLEVFKKNVDDFLNARKMANSSVPIYMHIITAKNYIDAVWKFFDRAPRRIKYPIADITAEAVEIRDLWKGRIDSIDQIGIEDNLMWAERTMKMDEKKEGDFSCINLARIKTNVFINPDGNWYICCFDAGNEIVIGNLGEHTMVELYDSEKRNSLITALEEKRFEDIGYPCTRVDCCQVVSNE